MRNTVDAPTKFYTTEKLTGNLELTPEGFLLCKNVPLARTGSMLYGPGETDIESGPGGYALVDCEPQDLFRPETMASGNGKPVLDEHPNNQDHGVGPDNWSELAKGTMMNLRRDDNLLVGDLLVMHQGLIESILGLPAGSLPEVVRDGTIQDAIKNRKGKREVSLGYEADYEQMEPGKGRKTNIIINHTAVVNSGRCGNSCKVNDHQPERTRKIMKNTLVDRLKKAFRTKDEEGFNQMLESEVEPGMTGDEEGGGVHVHLHTPSGAAPAVISGDKKTKDGEVIPAAANEGRSKFTDDELEKRFKGVEDSLQEIKGLVSKAPAPAPAAEADVKKPEMEADGDYVKPKEGQAYDSKEIEGELEEEAPEGTGDAARKSNDSSYLMESFRDTVAMAEIIAPGIKMPTYDKAWHPRVTYDNLCRLRRAALTKGLDDAATREIIVAARGRKTTDAAVIKKLTCDSARLLFAATGAAKKNLNNQAINDGNRRLTNDNARPSMAIKNVADINKRNSEFYKSN